MRRGDGRRVDERRIIVDRELGRTKSNWLPRRLGGGKGECRRDRRDEEVRQELQKQILREKADKERKAREEGRQEQPATVEGAEDVKVENVKVDTSVKDAAAVSSTLAK